MVRDDEQWFTLPWAARAPAAVPAVPGGDRKACPCCLRYTPGGIGLDAIAVAGHCQRCNPYFTYDEQAMIEARFYQRTGERGCLIL